MCLQWPVAQSVPARRTLCFSGEHFETSSPWPQFQLCGMIVSPLPAPFHCFAVVLLRFDSVDSAKFGFGQKRASPTPTSLSLSLYSLTRTLNPRGIHKVTD